MRKKHTKKGWGGTTRAKFTSLLPPPKRGKQRQGKETSLRDSGTAVGGYVINRTTEEVKKSYKCLTVVCHDL